MGKPAHFSDLMAVLGWVTHRDVLPVCWYTHLPPQLLHREQDTLVCLSFVQNQLWG